MPPSGGGTRGIMKNHTDRAHAVIAPSSVGRTMKCPGWIAAHNQLLESGELVEGPASTFAQEGTTAHEIAEYYGLHYGVDPKTFPEEFVTKGDEDMHMYGQAYAKFIHMLERKFTGAKGKVSAAYERRLKFSENIWGTLDYCMVGKRNGKHMAAIVDYKYGQGVDVSAEDNPQLKTYAACLAEESKRQGVTIEKFFFFIYQPSTPGDAYSQWKCDASVIEEWAALLVLLEQQVINNASDLSAEGLDHCRFCPVKPCCTAFTDEVAKGALTVINDAPDFPAPDIETLTLEQVVEVFTKKKAIEHFLKDVESHLLRKLETGEEVPGYKLVNGRSSRKWLDDEETVATALRGMGVEEPYRKSLITIGAVEKEVGKGKDAKAALEPLVSYTTPKKQIALESDKRKAIDVEANLAEALTTIE